MRETYLKNRKYKSGKVDRDFIALMAILSVVTAGFLVIIFSIFSDIGSHKKAYEAWVKQGGNSKNLTYEEWRSLITVDPRLVLKETRQ